MEPGIVANGSNPGAWEAKAGGSLGQARATQWDQAQLRRSRKTLSQRKTNKAKQNHGKCQN